MMRTDISLADHNEPGLFKRGEQLCSGSKFQMFGQVGEQEPAFSLRFQVCRQTVQETG